MIKEKLLNLKKKLRICKPDIWILQNMKVGDYGLICMMDSNEFDKKVKGMKKSIVPVIDGVAYTYLQTPAYPIIVQRLDKVGKDYLP